MIGVHGGLKGQVPVVFATLKRSDAGSVEAAAQMMRTVTEQLGAVARPSRVYVVNALPKTRSGKLLRRAIQAVCEGRDTGDLSTIEDPSALQQLQEAAQR